MLQTGDSAGIILKTLIWKNLFMCQLQLSLFKPPSKAERILLEALPWLDFYKYLGSLIKIKKYQISYPKKIESI
jgi:hypothetical protein